MELLIPDQRVGNISESTLDRLPVCNESLLVFRFSQSQIPAKRPACENRLAYMCAVRPDADLRSHKAGEDTASPKGSAARSSQGDLRKKLSLGHSNLGVRRNQNLLSLANIRTALNDRRREAGWNLGRERLLDERKSSDNILRIVSEQNADGIFLLSYFAFEVGYLGICRVEHLQGLEHVKLCGHAASNPELGQLD